MNSIPRETKDNRVVEKDVETKFYLCHISTFSLAVTMHSDIMMLGTNFMILRVVKGINTVRFFWE